MHNPTPNQAPAHEGAPHESMPAPPGARDLPITSALVAANLLIFMLEETWGSSESTATLLRMGAIFSGSPEYARWGTFLSYGYLHIGAIHLGMNMFALWNTGRLLEPLLGRARFFVLYTLSLLGGGIAISLSPNPHITAGASGAIFGLLGAICALLYRRYRNSHWPEERKEIRGSIGRMLVPNLIISLLPGVSLLGHAGGLVVGALFVARTFMKSSNMRARLQTPQPSRALNVAAVLLALLTLGAIASVWLDFRPWRPSETLQSRSRPYLTMLVAHA